MFARQEAQRRAEEPVGFLIDPASEGRYPQSDAAVQKTLSDLGHPHLMDDLRALSQNAGVEVPRVLIDYKQPRLGAAMKINGQNTLVLNDELLKSTSRKNLNGVIGHELAHIKLGHLNNDDSSYTPFEKLVVMAEPKLWRLAWRRRESAADREGALIAGSVDGLVDFFRDRMREQKETRPPGIISAITNSRPMRFLRSMRKDDHPTYEKRVKKLKQFARQYPAELQASKSALDGLWGKAGQQFAQAAPRAERRSPPPAALKSSSSAPRAKLPRPAPR